MPETITAEELDQHAHELELGEKPIFTPTKLRRAAATIRELEKKASILDGAGPEVEELLREAKCLDDLAEVEDGARARLVNTYRRAYAGANRQHAATLAKLEAVRKLAQDYRHAARAMPAREFQQLTFRADELEAALNLGAASGEDSGE